MKRLILFDIDETILKSDGAGRRAISRALREIFGKDFQMDHVSMSGKTDPQILHEILNHAGMDRQEIENSLESIYAIYIELLREEIDNAKFFRLHEGVVELLESLSNNDKTFLGLLTGNIEKGARLKLSRFELNDYFPIGAYGCDSADRMQLPAVAVNRAVSHFNRNFQADETVIIGDSIYDVLCAKQYGARSIAVNTGLTSKEQLEAQSPDYLFASLKDTNAVMDAIWN